MVRESNTHSSSLRDLQVDGCMYTEISTEEHGHFIIQCVHTNYGCVYIHVIVLLLRYLC